MFYFHRIITTYTRYEWVEVDENGDIAVRAKLIIEGDDGLTYAMYICRIDDIYNVTITSDSTFRISPVLIKSLVGK